MPINQSHRTSHVSLNTYVIGRRQGETAFFSSQHLIIMSGRKRILRSKQSSLLLKTTLLILNAETQTLIFVHCCHIFLLLKKKEAYTAYLQLVNKLLKLCKSTKLKA